MSKQPQGWHRADIKAALEKRGWSLYAISRHMGHSNPTTASTVLFKPWPVVQQLIGEILGVNPAEIWPERYNTDGTLKGRGVRRTYREIKRVGNSKNAAVA